MNGILKVIPRHKLNFLKYLAVFFFIYLLGIGSHPLWLPIFAKYLIVKTPLKKCDLIVVSAGSYYRFLYAIDLKKGDYAQKILLLGDERFKDISGEKTPLKMAFQEALDEGVAPEDLVSSNSTSTQDDAIVARKLMLARGLQSAIVISDRYNMKRVSIIFDRVFRDMPIDLVYAYSEADDGLVAPDRWWKTSPTFTYVIKEWIKIPLDLFMFERRLK